MRPRLHSTQDSAYKILNTVTISLHPDDVPSLEQGLEEPRTFRTYFRFNRISWQDKGPYLAIMTVYAVADARAHLGCDET